MMILHVLFLKIKNKFFSSWALIKICWHDYSGKVNNYFRQGLLNKSFRARPLPLALFCRQRPLFAIAFIDRVSFLSAIISSVIISVYCLSLVLVKASGFCEAFLSLIINIQAFSLKRQTLGQCGQLGLYVFRKLQQRPRAFFSSFYFILSSVLRRLNELAAYWAKCTAT